MGITIPKSFIKKLNRVLEVIGDRGICIWVGAFRKSAQARTNVVGNNSTHCYLQL